MKEKTYYEIIVEMEGKKYDKLETKLSLGTTCVELIKRIEDKKDVFGASKSVTVNGKKYDVKIFEWERRPENGIDKI